MVRTPAVLYRSFSPTGIPWSGPLYLPAWMSFSAWRAAVRDSSANSVMNEFSTGSVASILVRWASIISTGETSLSLTSFERSPALM